MRLEPVQARWRASILDQMEELDRQQLRLTEYVCAAREAGLSWTQIGHVTGLSKQGAQQRWGRVAAEHCRAVKRAESSSRRWAGGAVEVPLIGGE